MASSLHYVTPLQLSDTFNEWFLRSNDLIDVINKINVYNVENGWGLARYRGVDGTTVLRLNVGQQEKEYDGSAVAGDYKYGLRFIDDIYGTGTTNPDVSSTVKILTLDFENLPQGVGGIGGAIISESDYLAFSDTSSGTGSIAKVQAGNMLPYGISGDHRFYGNIYFDGTNTTINSSELFIDDKNIYLACTADADGGSGGLTDVQLLGAGIIIRGAEAQYDKSFTYDYTTIAEGGTFEGFKPNIDLMLSSSSKILSEDSSLDFVTLIDSDFDLSFKQAIKPEESWKIRKKLTGDGAGRLIFLHENTSTGVTSGAISLSKGGNVKIHQLDGDIFSGVTQESSFKYLPAPYSIPTTGMSGDSYLHYKWTNRKIINQEAHGFTSGDLLKYYDNGTTYEKAYNTSRTSAEVIAIVENDNGGSADSFVAVFSGLVDLSDWVPTGWGSETSMTAGEVYFLNDFTNAGGFTLDEPIINGDIRKPVLVSVDEKEALFVNYLGNVVSTGDSAAGASGDVVYSDGYLLNASVIPNQGYKNKIINGDFSFWQRAENSALGPSGAIDWNGSTGTRWASNTESFYTADMWLLETRHDGTEAEVQKYGHTFGEGPISTYSTQSRGSYLRALNNTVDDSSGEESYLINRIENVGTLASTSSENKVTLSYWMKGVSADVAGMSGTSVSLWQVFDGNSAEGVSYGGGATCCLGVDSSGVTSMGGHSAGVPATWTQKTYTYILNPMDDFSSNYDSDYNWLELRFSLPQQWGVSGGFDLARVQLESGATGTDWEERSIQEEEILVNRFYQRHPIYTTGYHDEGETAGVNGNWSVIPYPNYGVGNGSATENTSMVSSATYAFDRGSNNVYNASTGDIWMATSSDGFNVGRTAGLPGNVICNAVYHFDFGIYD